MGANWTTATLNMGRAVIIGTRAPLSRFALTFLMVLENSVLILR